MDNEPMTFTSLALIVLLLILLLMLACHYLGPRATTWLCSNKEEKIGLSKNKLFHANGYMIHSGSEFLLSNSGSFKRFDTIDKDDYKQSGQQPTQQTTTPLWNLPEGEVESNIPPQPLRPAPAPGAQAPGNAVHAKSVTFSFSKLNETSSTTEPNSGNGILVSCMRSSVRTASGTTPIPKPIEAPPPPRLSASSSALSSTAIPRPVAKRQISLQNGVNGHSNAISRDIAQHYFSALSKDASDSVAEATTTVTGRSHNKTLKRRNSSTNPFLCESAESFTESSTALQSHSPNTNNTNASNNNSQHYPTEANSQPSTPASDAESTITAANGNANGGINPFYMDIASANNHSNTNHSLLNDEAKLSPLQAQQFRNRSCSETASTETSELRGFSSSLRKLTQHTTNPFTGLTQKVQGPHMLQKTISEDFLFRKLGINHTHAHAAQSSVAGASATGGNSTWTFGRSLLRQDSIISMGRRNSSQCSLDSTGGSMDGINLERAISCDSVNSDSSVFLCELDQPYTQITGYLCVGLQYDKNSITDEGMEFNVMVLEAKGLICPFSVESLDTFVRIYLVPDEAGAMQTKVFKDSATPRYNESFNFWLKKQQGRHSLWFHLYHDGAAHTLIGEAEMEIGEMPRPITTWIPLSDSRKCNAQWGELMFSLSYLPTAERLTIVVVKARNLKLEVRERDNSKSPPQPVQSVFVKVYLMNNEKKVLKKRTSLKRKDRYPIFNESMIFSVPPQSLTTVQLRLTVFGVVELVEGATTTSIVPLGHVIAGSCATGKGLRHWHQMLSSLRKPVAMWHVLRRATYQPIFTGGAEAVVAAMQSTALRAKRNSIF